MTIASRCLQRHGIRQLPELARDKPTLRFARKEPTRRFRTYPIGYFHIDEVRTAGCK